MALGVAQLPTEMGKAQPAGKTDSHTIICELIV
jgi:hypothetical protein